MSEEKVQDQAAEETKAPEVTTETTAAESTASETSAETPVDVPPVVEEVAQAITPVVESAVAAAAAIAAPIVAEPVIAEAVPTVAVELSPFQKKMLEISAQGTPAQSGLIAKLTTYVEEMKPGKPMTGDAGVVKQHQLWRTIFSTIENAPVVEFKSLWSIILAFFHEHADGAFHESYIYRFSEHWKHNKLELDGFQRIINLIKVSADPKTRNATTKQVDLDKTLAQPFSEEGRNRLIGFYKK